MRSNASNRIPRLALWALLVPGALGGTGDATAAQGQSSSSDTPAAMVSPKPGYDEVGRASWYGNELAGRRTSSGEAFNPRGISAAHRTLPFDSFVEVTSLDSGRTILVRINDRGPVSRRRIVDLSLGAARQLGVEGQGEFPVRVRRVNPPEFERTALRKGLPAVERLPTPPGLLRALRKQLGGEPKSEPARQTPKRDAPSAAEPEQSATRWFIQVGAFSTEARARTAARQVSGTVTPAGRFWRVRTGPYASAASAKAALGPVAAKGYRDARITQ